MNGNNLAVAERVEQVEREQGARGVVVDLDRAFAAFFERRAQMLRRLPVRLGRADQADFAIEFLGKQGGAQIVISHVGGQNDGALRGAELVEPFRADDLIGELLLDAACKSPPRKSSRSSYESVRKARR